MQPRSSSFEICPSPFLSKNLAKKQNMNLEKKVNIIAKKVNIIAVNAGYGGWSK